MVSVHMNVFGIEQPVVSINADTGRQICDIVPLPGEVFGGGIKPLTHKGVDDSVQRRLVHRGAVAVGGGHQCEPVVIHRFDRGKRNIIASDPGSAAVTSAGRNIKFTEHDSRLKKACRSSKDFLILPPENL